eukprot:COSAG06_NODE_2623_length_6562_cov_9.546031_3_plen_108_part_00
MLRVIDKTETELPTEDRMSDLMIPSFAMTPDDAGSTHIKAAASHTGKVPPAVSLLPAPLRAHAAQNAKSAAWAGAIAASHAAIATRRPVSPEALAELDARDVMRQMI